MQKTEPSIPPLPGNAFSPDGYIVNQSALGCIPNGRYRSDYNGCGWISIYNTLKALGREMPAEAVLLAVRRWLLLGGMLGTNPFFIRRFFNKAGFFVKTALTKRAMARNLATADAAVLFYFHRHGAHFISVSPYADKLRVFNLTQAPEDYCTVPDLLSTFRFGLLFTFNHKKNTK